MPKFAYEGRTAGGEVKKGKIDAADQSAARAQLRKMNINPTTTITCFKFVYIHLYDFIKSCI